MRLALATAVVVAAVALAVAAGVGASGDRPPATAHSTRARAAITRVIAAGIRVPVAVIHEENVSTLTFAGGRLWTSGIGGALRVAPRSLNPAMSRFLFACQDGQVAVGLGAVWITGGDCGARGQVDMIAPGSLRLIRRIPLPAPADGIAIWRGAVWVTTPAGQSSRFTVLRIAPDGRRVRAVGGGMHGGALARFGTTPLVAAGAAALWTEASAGGLIRMLSRPSGPVRSTVLYGGRTAGGLAYGAGTIWAGLNQAVEPLDPVTGAVHGRPLVPPAMPTALAFGGGGLWIADADGTIYRYRSGASALVRVMHLPPELTAPTTLAFGGGYLWAASANDGGIARIGPLAGVPVSRPPARLVPPAFAPVA